MRLYIYNIFIYIYMYMRQRMSHRFESCFFFRLSLSLSLSVSCRRQERHLLNGILTLSTYRAVIRFGCGIALKRESGNKI